MGRNIKRILFIILLLIFLRFLLPGARALAFLHAHAAEYGGDPDRICLMGRPGDESSALILDFLTRTLGSPRSVQ